jgi:ABC-type transport system substrate-binding protein
MSDEGTHGNYWTRGVNTRLSRRRALIATASIGASAAFLAACGGDQTSEEPTDRSGLVTKAVDTSNQAKVGGVLKHSRNADIANFDPHFSLTSSSAVSPLVYGRLMQLKPGHLQEPDGTIIADLAESWEFSPDKLTLTMKMRQTKFAPLAPVNGRDLDVDDILYSWKRFSEFGAERSALLNSVSPTAPVLSLTAPDSRTLVMKLKEPSAAVVGTLGASTTGNFYIVPKEAEGQIDLRRDQIGTGPYYRSEYIPSGRLVVKRNPGYYDKVRPRIESIEFPIITEYAASLSQFRTGALYTFPVRAEEVVGLKREVPDLLMYDADFANPNIAAFFGWRPNGKTPFRDVRVRQALSRSWDRDLFIDLAYNVDKFEAEALTVETRWNSALYATAYKGWWLDPQSSDFGPNAEFYKYDIAEAKKLLAAAGFPNGLDVISNRLTTAEYGADWPRNVEVLEGMATEAGFRFQLNAPGWSTNWVPEFRDARGNFEGLSYRGTPSEPDIGQRLFAEFSKDGNRFTGFDPAGSGSFAGDPQAEDMLLKIRREFDDEKRKVYAKDLQRYLGKMQYYIKSPGGSTSFQLAWPALQNFNVSRTTNAALLNYDWWLDDTKAPLGKA